MSDKAAWMALADELGLEFKEGIDALLESPTLQKMAGPALGFKDLSQAKAIFDNPLVHSLLTKVFIGSISGTYRELEFILFRGSATTSRSSGQRTVHHVHVNVLFRKDQQMGLDITGTWWGAKLGKLVMPGRYLAVAANPDLDKLVVVNAEGKSQAKVLLGRNDLTTALLKMYQFSKEFHITDHGIRYHEPGRIIAADRARIIMDLMAEAADKFGH